MLSHSFSDGEWVRLYQVVDSNNSREVFLEMARQLDTFERLLGRTPTLLDSHQHVHRNEPTRSFVLDIGKRLDIPVRDLTPSISYCGRFYGHDD
jgi:predicted glycoside hydrolase/deacetylase ChbG (UPF0249 family)